MPRRNYRSNDDEQSQEKPRGKKRAGQKRRKTRRTRDESESIVPFYDPSRDREDADDDYDFLDEDFDARIDYGDDVDDLDGDDDDYL